MKNLFFAPIAILVVALGCATQQKPDEMQKNKEISARYHLLNAADVDSILADNFIGRTGNNLFTWKKEDHRKYLSNGSYKVDSIFDQVAEGDRVATRFVRTGDFNGDTVRVELMQFKRFEKGKIAEIWEYWDYNMLKAAYDKMAAKEAK